MLTQQSSSGIFDSSTILMITRFDFTPIMHFSGFKSYLLLVGTLVRGHAARGVTRATVAGRILEQRVLRPAWALKAQEFNWSCISVSY